MATRTDRDPERRAAENEDEHPKEGSSEAARDDSARDVEGGDDGMTTRAGERRDGDEQPARSDDTSPDETTTVVSDSGTVTTVDGGTSDVITVGGDETVGDDPDTGNDEADSAGPDLAAATWPGGLQDHLGMAVEPDAHLVDLPGHRALADAGTLPGSAGENLSSVAHDPGGFDRGSVGASPRDDERALPDDGDPFGQRTDPFAGFDEVQSRPGNLYDNPNVVGADREALAAEAANPDLTHLVDMEAISGGQVGGTIDGRTPDGGAGGPTGGFTATTGFQHGDLLAGATSQQSTPSSSSPLSPKVKTGGPEGVSPTGPGTVHKETPWYKKLADYFMQGSPDSPKAKALKQATDTIDELDGAPPAEPENPPDGAPPAEPERPDEGPETEMPADPDAGGPPPMGLDLSREWAIGVWARENADVNPNPMGDGLVAGAAQSMDISGFVEQYDEPQVTPNVDPEAALEAHRDSIGEQFTELDG